MAAFRDWVLARQNEAGTPQARRHRILQQDYICARPVSLLVELPGFRVTFIQWPHALPGFLVPAELDEPQHSASSRTSVGKDVPGCRLFASQFSRQRVWCALAWAWAYLSVSPGSSRRVLPCCHSPEPVEARKADPDPSAAMALPVGASNKCTRRLVGHDGCPSPICPAIHQIIGRRAEDAADGAALIRIPIRLSGKEGEDYDFEIEKE